MERDELPLHMTTAPQLDPDRPMRGCFPIRASPGWPTFGVSVVTVSLANDPEPVLARGYPATSIRICQQDQVNAVLARELTNEYQTAATRINGSECPST